MENSRNYFLDCLRGICIIFIIITHAVSDKALRLQFFFPLWIETAVPIFMFISGYVTSLSFEQKQVSALSGAYNLNSVIRKYFRIIVPYLMIFLCEAIILIIKRESDFLSLMRALFLGGFGPGSYYTSLVVQLIFTAPVIYFIVKKYHAKGLLIAFVFQLVYHVFCAAVNINEDAYRQLVFRYTFIIAFGAFMCLNKKKVNPLWYIASFVLGLSYLIARNWFGFETLAITMWQNTSLYAVLYIIPILAFLMNKATKIRIKPLEWLGTRTYDIFLIQMFYFAFFSRYISNTFTGVMFVIVSIILCLTVGIIFHAAEVPLAKCITGGVIKLKDKIKL